jgi:hypothetical protein
VAYQASKSFVPVAIEKHQIGIALPEDAIADPCGQPWVRQGCAAIKLTLDGSDFLVIAPRRSVVPIVEAPLRSASCHHQSSGSLVPEVESEAPHFTIRMVEQRRKGTSRRSV